jgi:hypothetical protein
MKTNHLFASAALTAVWVAASYAHAQILGGAMHGGASSTQAATFGGGFGTLGSTASGRADLSSSGPAGGRVDGLGHVDRTAKAGAQAAARDAGRTKADTAAAGRQAVGAGGYEASKASNGALGTARAATGATATTGVTAAGQGETQVRDVSTADAVASGLPATQALGRKPQAGSSGPSARQPVTTTKPDSLDTPRPSSTPGDSGSSAPNPKSTGSSNGGEIPRGASTHGETDANASASVDASAAH